MSGYFITRNKNGVLNKNSLNNVLAGYNVGGTTTGYTNMGSYSSSAFSGETPLPLNYKYNNIDLSVGKCARYIDYNFTNASVTIPNACTALRVILIGGGGGGAGGGAYIVGSSYNTPGDDGTGGSGAGYGTYLLNVSSSSVNTYSIVVGSGGAGGGGASGYSGSAGGNGVNGGNTSITFNGITCTANGGKGGIFYTTMTGGTTSGSNIYIACKTGKSVVYSGGNNVITGATTDTPTPLLPYITGYGKGGNGGYGAQSPQNENYTGENGFAGSDGYIRVYYVF